MIRHRTYAVPLTAVLLALATGIALGAGPLTDVGSNASPGPRVVTRPSASGYADTFAAAVAGGLYQHRLARRPVALVSLPGASPATVTGIAAQVRLAGGTVSATYAVTPLLVDPQQKSLVDTLGSQLDRQLRHGASRGASTYPRMGQLVGIAIANRGAAGAPAGDDAVAVRQSLVAAKLLRAPAGDPQTAPLVLVVLGSPVDQPIADGLVAGLGARARGVVAVATTKDPTLAGLHADGVTRTVTTVDGSETAAGRVAAVLALIRAWGRPGGAFGASGASGPVPLG